MDKTADTSPVYYSIDEAVARRAKEMNSFYDYKAGSATEEYRRCVDEATEVARKQKAKTDPVYHEKIDALLDTYARKLADNMNKGFAIDARVPSVMIAGGSNFPVRKKEKQNAAWEKNMEDWNEIQKILEKIKSTGTGGIRADDPNALKRLEDKLKSLESSQAHMKEVNAYYRKHRTLDGCTQADPEEIQKLKASMASPWHVQDKPFPSYALSNNSAEIRRIRSRIEELKQNAQTGFCGWDFDGGKAVADQEANRLRLFFNEKPSLEQRSQMRHHGFIWAPSANAWQRMLNRQAIYAAGQLPFLQPLSGKTPLELQPESAQKKHKPLENTR